MSQQVSQVVVQVEVVPEPSQQASQVVVMVEVTERETPAKYAPPVMVS